MKLRRRQNLQKNTSNFEKHTSKNPLKIFFSWNFKRDLIDLIAPLNLQKVLDAGCGEGFTLQNLYELKIGNILEGIDFSKDAVRIGKKQYPHLNLRVGDIYNLPFKENSFDLVICTEVLEHLENPVQAISELKRVTSKYILFTVPNEPWWMLFNFTKWGKQKEIGHINHWSSSQFKKMIKESGLKVQSLKLPFPWTMILAKKS